MYNTFSKKWLTWITVSGNVYLTVFVAVILG